MAVLDSWENIKKHGLLSTSALLDLFEITGTQRYQIESTWRPKSISISHPKFGTVIIRDQAPMPETELTSLLIDMTPQQWYKLINGKTFFWADEQRLLWMLGAQLYRNSAHCVLTLDTKTFVTKYMNKIYLTDQNTGSTNVRKLRNMETFKKIKDFNSRWVVEVVVDYHVPDISKYVIRVEKRQQTKVLGQIWP